MWPFIGKSLEMATLFMFAGLGELLDQRSGVLNVGLEGLMLFGAASGFITATLTQSLLLGFLVGIAVGGAVGFLHGYLSITLRVNQVVSGMAIWILAFGLTTYLANPFTGPLPRGVSSWRIGDLLSPLFFVGVALVLIVWFILSKTHLGLKIRAVGEDPSVAEASGINVVRTRYLCVIIGGMLGGLSGAFLSLTYLGSWSHNPVAGRGWVSLALVFLSMWRPWLLFAGASIFGTIWQFALSPEIILPALGLPLQFYRMIPFAVTIVILVVISTERFRKRWGLAKPAALGLPYAKE
ncbi:MAG: ABC transporter permease [Nitrososphaeria archaeon]